MAKTGIFPMWDQILSAFPKYPYPEKDKDQQEYVSFFLFIHNLNPVNPHSISQDI